MNHRIRLAYENMGKGLGKLQGKVQMDETFIGGEAKFMSKKNEGEFQGSWRGSGRSR